MRKILFSLLLASVAASPAMASRPPERDGEQGRAARQERVESARAESSRSERVERQSSDRPRFELREQASPRAMTGDPGWARRGPDDNPMHAGRDPRASFDRSQGGSESVEQIQQRFERRQQAVRDNGERQRRNDQWRERIDGPRGGVPVVSDVPRPGTQPPLRTDSRRTRPVQWSGAWRGDNRYDWQQHRRRHRSLFHLGFYYDPFGWNYQPYQVGWRMWPSYYSSRYWINDPWAYRLPYAPPGYRWIRYWDDALLVDTWTGQVVDSIPNFFW